MIVNKINAFITNPIFRRIVGQSRTTINMRDIMDTGKILLVKLPGKFERMTEILGAMIIAQLLAASYAREKQQKRQQFHIYADEFQRFATRDFAKLLTEASRKYKTPVTIAHQARDFIDLKNKAASIQVGNLIVLRISDKDAKELAGNFYLEPEPTDTREKPVRTPVIEPIQYMLTHGIHPLDNTRTFMEVYGKRLVELAKKEEDDERARVNEERRYDHDLLAGVRYIAPPQIQVTYHYRNLLNLLNNLFYEAGKAGRAYQEALKAGTKPDNLEQTLDAILASWLIPLVDTYIEAFERWRNGYRDALAEYQSFVSERSGAELRYDQRLKDGIFDVLAEDFHARNRVWWQAIHQHGLEHSLFPESHVALLPVPNSGATSDTALTTLPGVTGRKETLQTMLTQLPVALARKTASIRRKETNAQQRLREAYREYLLAEVRAARANMLFVEKNRQFVAVIQDDISTAHIFFPNLFSHEELYASFKVQAQKYNRDALIIFQYEEDKYKGMTYDELRNGLPTGFCLFFNTWKEAASFYFHLFRTCWFHINPTTFFDKRNWQKTEREVYWRRSYTGVVWDRNIYGKGLPKPEFREKEDKKRLWLQTWELKPGIENTWVTPTLLEAEIEQAITPDHSIQYTRDDLLGGLLSLETRVFNPKYNHFGSPLEEKTGQLHYLWKQARERTFMVPEQAAIAAQESQIEAELAMLERIEAEKKTYDAFVAEFREKMRQIIGELAMLPVQQESGLWTEEPIGRMSYADTAGKLANVLSNLPNFIARVRITNEADELVEYIIRTLKPEQGLGEEKLKERIARIKRHMIGEKYVRSKAEVDREISKRHELLRQNGQQPLNKALRQVDM